MVTYNLIPPPVAGLSTTGLLARLVLLHHLRPLRLIRVVGRTQSLEVSLAARDPRSSARCRVAIDALVAEVLAGPRDPLEVSLAVLEGTLHVAQMRLDDHLLGRLLLCDLLGRLLLGGLQALAIFVTIALDIPPCNVAVRVQTLEQRPLVAGFTGPNGLTPADDAVAFVAVSRAGRNSHLCALSC